VNWYEEVAFCNALSEQVGLQPCYHIAETAVTWATTADATRLPTEAEWEYACRAGTTTRRFWGDDDTAMERYAWFVDNAGHSVHPVGEKTSNPWGPVGYAGQCLGMVLGLVWSL
jgi:formylglycine-generating enzyme required for sulfatase activity